MPHKLARNGRKPHHPAVGAAHSRTGSLDRTGASVGAARRRGVWVDEQQAPREGEVASRRRRAVDRSRLPALARGACPGTPTVTGLTWTRSGVGGLPLI